MITPASSLLVLVFSFLITPITPIFAHCVLLFWLTFVLFSSWFVFLSLYPNPLLQCWCGGQRTDFDVHGPATACTAPCAGNTGEICGGSFVMSVYENDGGVAEDDDDVVVPETPSPIIPIEPPTAAPVTVVEEPTPSPITIIDSGETLGTPAPINDAAGFTLLGCFADSNGSRIMSNGPNFASPMSAEVNKIKRRGATYTYYIYFCPPSFLS